MANIIIFDPLHTDVPGRVTLYVTSVSTPDYDGYRIINPDLTFVTESNSNYWIVSDWEYDDGYDAYDGYVSDMTIAEKSVVDEIIKAKTIPEKKYNVKEYTGNRLDKELWYEKDNGDGTYDKKSEETTYSYSGNKLVNSVIKIFHCDGTEQSTKTTYYYTSGNSTIIKIS